MDLDKYQQLSRRTLPQKHLYDNLTNYCLGIAGESGEVADEIKKVIFHGHNLDVGKVKSELGDVLHYVAGIATMLELDLSEVAQANIDKLKRRYPDGFNEKDSVVYISQS